MDEAHHQLLHEFRKAAAYTAVIMDHQDQPEGPLDVLRSAWVSGDFSDLTIVCRDQTWQVHKVVILGQSPVLAAAMAESQMPDTLDLSGEDFDSVEKLIMFLYINSYSTNSTGPALSLRRHLRIHALANKLSIGPLATLACTLFAEALGNVDDLDVYLDTAIDVYEQVPFKNLCLRRIVTGALAAQMARMIAEPRVRDRLVGILREVPGFCGDVLTEMTAARERERREMSVRGGVLCEHCGPNEAGYKVEVQCVGCAETLLHRFV